MGGYKVDQRSRAGWLISTYVKKAILPRGFLLVSILTVLFCYCIVIQQLEWYCWSTICRNSLWTDNFQICSHMNEASYFWECKWHWVPDIYTSLVLNSLETAFVTGLFTFTFWKTGLANSCDSGHYLFTRQRKFAGFIVFLFVNFSSLSNRLRNGWKKLTTYY